MSSSSRQHSGGWGGGYGPAVPWDVFDALPRPLRELYKTAAYNYTPITAVLMLRAGRSPEDAYRRLRRRFRILRDAEVLRLYGPSHPQAAAS